MNPVALRQQVTDWQMMQPHPRLRPHVLCYYLALPTKAPGAGSLAASNPPVPFDGEELLIPDGHSELVFTIDNAFERWAVGQPERREVMRHSYVIGGRSHSVITRDLGPVAVAGVKLDPRALRWLIDTPLSEFRDSTLTLQELKHAPLLELDDAVAHAASRGAASAQAVAQALDGALLHALRDMPLAARPIDALVGQIRTSHGSLSILSWIEEHGLCARQVERDFATHIGMTPKRYARVIRFKHSYHQLIGGTTRPWGAHLDGYYDQSHFNKEFRAFIGAPPTARLAATLRQGTSISDHLLAGELR